MITFREGTNIPRRSQPRQILYSILFSILVLLSVCPVYSQQTLADADWFTRPLGEGVVWNHYLFENMFGGRQSISYLEIDLNNPDVSVEMPYVNNKRQRISSMIPEQFPGAAGGINGTYFNTRDGGHRTYLRVDNTAMPRGGTWSPWGSEGALGIDAEGKASILNVPEDGWESDTVHPDIIACGPTLLIDGVIQSESFKAIGAHCTNRHPRSAVGMTETNKLILLTVDGRTDMASGMTCEELADVMAQLNCTNAVNFDGGGSTTLWGRGEPFNGIINYPSDNGAYDHSGERSCVNGIAVIAPPVKPLPWDGRLTGKTYTQTMIMKTTQTMVLTFENIGEKTWTAADTRLVLARTADDSGKLRDDSWVSETQPALMTPETVAKGEVATFSFKLNAPEVPATAIYTEHFKLVQTDVGRIGPADSEAWIRIAVEPPPTGGDEFIVESRLGGQNYSWYKDEGFADTRTNCTVKGTRKGLGMRYGSTYRSVAGAKAATIAPDFPADGLYKVYVAWGSGSSRRNPVTYKVTHADGMSEFHIDQSAISNIWMQLGTEPFRFKAGLGGTVVMSNEDIDASGTMYSGAYKFELVPEKE